MTTPGAKLSPSQAVLTSVHDAAARLRVRPEIVALLDTSWRELHAQLPVRMDDGSLRIFEGYRVQHNGARGPYKGGLRYHPQADIDEVYDKFTELRVKRERERWGAPISTAVADHAYVVARNG